MYLRKNRELLKQYDVEVEFHPIFLGGINVGSGNKPPWSLPAKAKYGPYDLKRAVKWFGTKKLQSAPFFPILSVFVSTVLGSEDTHRLTNPSPNAACCT